jgi:hypothetical protein
MDQPNGSSFAGFPRPLGRRGKGGLFDAARGVCYAMVYNVVRLVTAEAARRQQVDTQRIRFVDALRLLLDAKPGHELVELKVNPIDLAEGDRGSASGGRKNFQ